MEEKFIKWLNTYNEFKEGTELRAIIDDAIKCYKFNIPRPALMLSYLAFMLAVRNNLLSSDKPDLMSEGYWNGILNDLRNEKRWEERLLSCVKAHGDDSKQVYNIELSVREDVEYWKNRRNDCAHYKKEDITLSHVSAFWSFLMSHYNQFSPLGSIRQCINEYNDYFDISKTPRGADQTAIFNRLILAVKSKDDILTFLRGLKKSTYKEQLSLIDKCLETPHIQDYVREMLLERDRNAVDFLEAHPDKVSFVWGDNHEKVREYWYNNRISFGYHFTLFIEILKARLMPNNEMKEAISHLLQCGYDNNECPQMNDEERTILMNTGLEEAFDSYISKASICNNPGIKCHKTDFYMGFINIIGLTERLVLTINDSMAGSFPYTLADRIRHEVLNEEDNRKIYKAICDRNGVEPLFDISPIASKATKA